jgi:hypothetical protein
VSSDDKQLHFKCRHPRFLFALPEVTGGSLPSVKLAALG